MLSYYSTILTILTTLPAVVTGVVQLAPVIQRDGFQSKKAKVGAVHALLNDIALFGTIYNWWTRSQQIGFTPSTTNVLVSSALALPITMYSAYLGGSLVYEYGMGFSRATLRRHSKKSTRKSWASHSRPSAEWADDMCSSGWTLQALHPAPGCWDAPT